MAKRAGTRFPGLVTMSGMAAFIGVLAVAPRVSYARTEDATLIKYEHKKPSAHAPIPADPGLIISPGPKPPPTTTSPARGKPFSSTDWIFDTGATTHVCGNGALLHSYDTLNPHSRSVGPRAVGYFGPNPIPINGAGDCTFILPALTSEGAPVQVAAAGKSHLATRMTLKNVMHIPDAGVNLISWSQLKRSRGLDLRLVEERDGSLTIRKGEQAMMRFELRDGLWFLVQLPPRHEGDEGKA